MDAELKAPTLDETVLRMKTEILADVQAGQVSKDVKSFSELHDFVDANEYGGLCEESLSAALIDHFGGRDENEAMPDGMMHYLNSAQNMISTWITDGGIAAHLDQSSTVFKVRNENGEFWTDEENGSITEVVFTTINEAVADAVTFLREATEGGLDYSGSDIEVVEFDGDNIASVSTVAEILERGNAMLLKVLNPENRRFIEDALAQADKGMRP